MIPPGGDPQTTRVALVVSNNNGGPGTATVVDATGDTNIGVFQMGNDPVHATFYAGTTIRAFVAERGADSVASFGPMQIGTPVAITGLPAGSRPVYVSAVGSAYIFVAESGTNKVGVIQGATGNLLTELPVGVDPVAIAETPDRLWAYVANKGSGTVSVFSAATLALDTTLVTGSSPVWVVPSSDSSTVYVLNQGSATISVIDVATQKIVGTVPTGATPNMMAFDAANRRLYVANTGANTVSVYDAATQVPVLLRTVTVGAAPTAVAPLPDGSRFYVTNSGCTDPIALTGCSGNSVSVVDARSFTVAKTVTVGSTPVWLAASPESTKVVVANRDSNNITDIRTLDDVVVSTINSASPQPVFVTINGT